MSTQGGLDIVTDGLVFQVDGANNLADNVTNVKNIVTPTETGSFVNGASVVSGAYDFDGVSKYINSDSSLPSVINDTQGSIELWVKVPDATPVSNSYLIGSGTSGADDGTGLWMGLTRATSGIGAGRVFTQIRSNGSADRIQIATPLNSLQDNTWHCIVVTQDGILPQIYIDGVKPTNTTTNNDGGNTDHWFGTAQDTLTNLAIGRISIDNGATIAYYNGQIANAKIYNKALTAAEIQQNYEALKHRFE